MDRIWTWLSVLLILCWTVTPVFSVTRTLVDTDSSQVLSNKTLASPVITGDLSVNVNGTINGQLNVKAAPYNAVGDGIADDTAAIQAALDACVLRQSGEIVFPQGTYNHAALTLAPASSQVHCNLRGLSGSGSFGTRLRYTGTGGTGVTIKNNSRFLIQNLAFEDAGTGAIGMHLTSLAAGCSTANGLFENVRIEGFDTDLQIGTTDNKAACELVFFNLETSAATTGITVLGPNTGPNFSTVLQFNHWAATGNVTNFLYQGPTTSNITSLSFHQPSLAVSANGTAFDIQAPVFLTFIGGYSEGPGPGTFLKSGSATPTLNTGALTNITFIDSYIAYTTSPSNVVMQFNQPGHYKLVNSSIGTGSIMLGGFDGGGAARKSQLTVENTSIISASPRIQYRAGSNTVWLVRHLGSGYNTDDATLTDDDRTYLIRTDGTEWNLSYLNWNASATTVGTFTGPTPPTVAFGSLGAPPNGTQVFCNDCTFANPCAGSGTGAMAKRLNGAWRCD